MGYSERELSLSQLRDGAKKFGMNVSDVSACVGLTSFDSLPLSPYQTEPAIFAFFDIFPSSFFPPWYFSIFVPCDKVGSLFLPGWIDPIYMAGRRRAILTQSRTLEFKFARHAMKGILIIFIIYIFLAKLIY